MVMEDNESCGSRPNDASSLYSPALSPSPSSQSQTRQQRQKLEVYNEVIRRLKDSNNDEALQPGFDDQLWSHFNRLPTRYALDVNVQRPEDVLMHKRLLHLAFDPVHRPAIEVRLVQVHSTSDGNSAASVHSDFHGGEAAHNAINYSSRHSIHPPPAFGSSPNLEALALEAEKNHDPDEEHSVHANAQFYQPMHEITFSSEDKPKLLSQLTSLLAEMGLNIQEAHAFSTVDGYSLDVFVVDGWPYEDTEQLKTALEREVLKLERQAWPNPQSLPPVGKLDLAKIKCEPDHLTIPNDGTDVWEIDPNHLTFGNKIASGSYGDLYKGTYCSQEVAIKVLKPERVNSDMQREFAQEVFIMRDLKAAILLMDENEVVKVADFGVARVKTQSGVMTAETGTHRWMAPEGLQPIIPKHTHPKLAELLEKCWQQDPALRPDYSEIIEILQQTAKEVGDEGEGKHKEKSSGGLLSVLRRGHH